MTTKKATSRTRSAAFTAEEICMMMDKISETDIKFLKYGDLVIATEPPPKSGQIKTVAPESEKTVSKAAQEIEEETGDPSEMDEDEYYDYMNRTKK